MGQHHGDRRGDRTYCRPLIWLIGAKAYVPVYLPGLLLAASIGVWLFYVQHQFEAMTWRDGESWTLHEAVLHGSSHYDLPTVLRWITANIGVHHRLPRVPRDYPELAPIGRLTLRVRAARVVG
jgi:acyl-lipid omega-6 desaturase (Delta-12 desaturase)